MGKEKWNENVETCSDCEIKWKKIGQQCPVCYAPKEKHICCNGECNHDDCCGKVEANCLLLDNMPEVKIWEKEFDKAFCRLDKSFRKRGHMEGWFLRDYVTGKQVKKFISKLLKDQECKHCAKRHERCWGGGKRY